MNKPSSMQPATDDPGLLDEHGQQIWSPDEEAAIARLHADPEYWAGIEEALAQADAGLGYTPEEIDAYFVERRRQWRAEHGRCG